MNYYGYGYINDMFRKAVKSSNNTDDIIGALNLFFESCDDLKVPIDRQWRHVGIIFDQYRKGEL